MGMIDTLRKIFKDSNNRPLMPEDDSGKRNFSYSNSKLSR